MTTAADLDGPRHAPAAGGPAGALIVFLHGLGADGNDLIGLAPVLAQVVPDAAFVSPHAPFPCDMAPFGRQWFSFRNQAPADILAGVQRAAPILDGFIDAELARHNLGDERLALIGFSQGTMMALHVALRRAQPCAALIGFSGALLAPELLADEIKGRPPVMLIHGEADEVVPFPALAAAESVLRGQGVAVRSLARPGLGHGIDEVGLTQGAIMLRQALSGQADAAAEP